MNFQIIKQTEFSFTKDSKETKGVNYVVAHKGRAMQVSSLNFEAGQLNPKDGVLSISGDIELVAKPYTNGLGETVKGISVMPKMDIAISAL